MNVVDQRPDESWRIYTKRLAKLNRIPRRRVLKWLRRHGGG